MARPSQKFFPFAKIFRFGLLTPSWIYETLGHQQRDMNMLEQDPVYLEGYSAGERDIPRSENPYMEGTQCAMDWDEGWFHATIE